MRTEYDEEAPAPSIPGKKRTKRERRNAQNRRARSVACGACNHSRPDHTPLLGRDRANFVWCPVCNRKCEKEKWNARLGD